MALIRALGLMWEGYYGYTDKNVDKYAPARSGVYKIGIVQEGGRLKVRYIGQTNDLQRALKEHLDFDSEQKECLRSRLEKYAARFAFAEISGQKGRDGAERALYYHYRPVCNDEDSIPTGPDVVINYR